MPDVEIVRSLDPFFEPVDAAIGLFEDAVQPGQTGAGDWVPDRRLADLARKAREVSQPMVQLDQTPRPPMDCVDEAILRHTAVSPGWTLAGSIQELLRRFVGLRVWAHRHQGTVLPWLRTDRYVLLRADYRQRVRLLRRAARRGTVQFGSTEEAMLEAVVSLYDRGAAVGVAGLPRRNDVLTAMTQRGVSHWRATHKGLPTLRNLELVYPHPAVVLTPQGGRLVQAVYGLPAIRPQWYRWSQEERSG